MKNIFLLVIALTALHSTLFANSVTFLKCELNGGDSLSTNDSIEMQWKTSECEIFLFKNGHYKINYVDGKYSQGIWAISLGKFTFYKDEKNSTSDKDFQFNQMTKEEFDKMCEEKYGHDVIDPYPLLIDENK